MSEIEEEYDEVFEEKVTKEIERMEKFLNDNPDLSYGLRVRYEGGINTCKAAHAMRKKSKQLRDELENNKLRRKDNLQVFKGIFVIIFVLAALFGFLYFIKVLAEFKIIRVIFIIFAIIMFFVVLFERVHWINIENRKYR